MMKVYCVLEGGGVKGAGLAGALAAVEEEGIEIIGYGGSSVGAIIATLGAAGFTGEEIGEAMKNRKFTKFLGWTGYRLLAIRYSLQLLPIKIYKVCTRRGFVQWLFSLVLWPLATTLTVILLPFHIFLLGVYSGNKLVDTTLEIIREKYQEKFDDTTTFEDFHDMGGKELRILASDITYRTGPVFSFSETPEMRVVDAIRASAGYPYVFRPFRYKNKQEETESHLLDGGITTNLPGHLFQSEYEVSGINTLVLDLVQDKRKRRPAWHIVKLTSDLIGTALDSSDEIISSLAIGVIHVPVKISNTVDALNFNLSKLERIALFEQGKQSAALELAANEKYDTLRVAGNDVQRHLMKNHGHAPAYSTVLTAIITDLSMATKANNIRACVILPTGDLREGEGRSLMVTYTAGFGGDKDKALELEEGEGAAWDLWELEDQDFIAVDLTDTKFSKTVPEDKQALIPNDRNSLIAFKIYTQNLEVEGRRIFGILGIDSSTPLADTGWTLDNEINADIFTIIDPWLKVIPLIMRGHLL